MRFALFVGCNIPARLPQYEASTRAVLERFGVELIELKEFNCCGYPLRNVNFRAFLLLSARNLALAEGKGLEVMVLCQCCYGSLKKAQQFLKEDPSVLQEVNRLLGREGLGYKGEVEVKHLLQVLHRDVGVESIREKVRRPQQGLRVAAHYGCHALRPSPVVQFDDPSSPSLLEELVEVTGAEAVPWGRRLDCCGAPLLGVDDDLSMALTRAKLEDGARAEAHCLCVACPYCQLQFDTVQERMLSEGRIERPLPSILYPQLLALSLGVDGGVLGLDSNRVPLRLGEISGA